MKPRFANVGNPALRNLYLGDTEPYVPPAEELVIPLNERKYIQTLTEGCCRWPIGDPQQADFHFCGKDKVPGLPYCEVHARRAFQPPQARRRERDYAPMVSWPARIRPGAGRRAGMRLAGRARRPSSEDEKLCQRGRWRRCGEDRERRGVRSRSFFLRQGQGRH